jgi:hypothetical protein
MNIEKYDERKGNVMKLEKKNEMNENNVKSIEVENY